MVPLPTYVLQLLAVWPILHEHLKLRLWSLGHAALRVIVIALHLTHIDKTAQSLKNLGSAVAYALVALPSMHVLHGSAMRVLLDGLYLFEEVVLAAVAQDGGALEHASAELKADKEVVLAAVA